MCSGTHSPCGDIIAGIRLHEAEHGDVKSFWRHRLNTSLYGDGACGNMPIVKRTIAALCAYDNQVLGRFLSERLHDEDRIDIMAENHIAYWFKRSIDFYGGKVKRLLFVFELLIRAFDFR
jgi:hypothetical protein